MEATIPWLAAALSEAVSQVPCAATNDPSDPCGDVWLGLGGIGDQSVDPYVNYVDLQSDPTPVATTLAQFPISPGGMKWQFLAALSSITGGGSVEAGCGSQPFPPRVTCEGSPAGAAGFGYPCFRPDSIPVMVLATDESSAANHACPTADDVVTSAVAAGVRIMGVYGDSSIQARDELEELANRTGAVGASGPLVMSIGSANGQLESAFRSILSNTRVNVSVEVRDDATDSVDVVASFVERVEIADDGAGCTTGLQQSDSDGDGFPDTYASVRGGLSLCWRVVAKSNTSIPATSGDQVFGASIVIQADGVADLDTQPISFVVPKL